MATKKSAAPKSFGQLAEIQNRMDLRSGPEIFRINKAAQAQLNKMKTDFAKKANEVIAKGQQ